MSEEKRKIRWCRAKCKDKHCPRHISKAPKEEAVLSRDFKGTKYCPHVSIIDRSRTVKIEERGWAGHFIGSARCGFRRNTLLTCGKTKWIVSTIGNYCPYDPISKSEHITEVSCNRWYETMCFESSYDQYNDADVSKEISINGTCGIYGETIEEVEQKYGDLDLYANEMHENVVKEMIERIKQC